MKSARNRMDMTAAYREVGTYRGAAAMCGCDPKTIKRALARLAAGDVPAERKEPERNYDVVADVVVARVRKTAGKISAKRVLLEAAPLAMWGRRAISGVWSPRQRRIGAGAIIGGGDRRCGRRVTRW